jgi:hypothetical protein
MHAPPPVSGFRGWKIRFRPEDLPLYTPNAQAGKPLVGGSRAIFACGKKPVR